VIDTTLTKIKRPGRNLGGNGCRPFKGLAGSIYDIIMRKKFISLKGVSVWQFGRGVTRLSRQGGEKRMLESLQQNFSKEGDQNICITDS